MGPRRSKIKKTSKSIMKSTKVENRYYAYAAVLGICIACLPLFVVASQQERQDVGASGPIIELDDLEAAESQNIGVAQRAPVQIAPVAVPTNPIPAVAIPPPNLSSAMAAPPAGFTIPKTDLAGSPSYSPRYVVPPVDPWRENLPFEVQQFRRRAQDDEGKSPDDDYTPQESKGKKHSPGVFKKVRNSIRNTGKAIVGAPSYIFKRYRGTWKKYFGGGGKKKKGGGWKAWSPSDKNDGWGTGWEEVEPSGGYYDEPSHYPSDKGWKTGKDSSNKGFYDSNERRSDRDRDRESTGYRDYRDRDNNNNKDYDSPPPSRPSTRQRGERERPKGASNYREETHYDDYDGRRTTAYYGGSSKKQYSRRPSSATSGNAGNGGSYKYDDDYK